MLLASYVTQLRRIKHNVQASARRRQQALQQVSLVFIQLMRPVGRHPPHHPLWKALSVAEQTEMHWYAGGVALFWQARQDLARYLLHTGRAQ